MDVTPLIPEGRQFIEGYGDLRFRISGEVYESSVLVFPDRTLLWEVTDIAALTIESLEPVRAAAEDVDLLLLGCGRRMQLIGRGLRDPLREQGIVVEPMDTGAACRTYNVLLAEERRVAAALIAV